MEVAEKIELESERPCYVRDDMPGYRRVRRGRGFSVLGPDGRLEGTLFEIMSDPDVEADANSYRLSNEEAAVLKLLGEKG